MFERQSALASAMQAGGRDGATGQRLLRLGEVRGWSLFQIAAFAATMDEFKDVVEPALSAALPRDVGAVATAEDRQILKTGPQQFWIVSREGDDLGVALRDAFGAGIGAVTPLSHSRTRIFIEGSVARELLAQGIALDLHPDVFRRDQFALTGLHHTTVLLQRSGENRYELYLMRTFALSVWEWLTAAALQFGYDVSVESAQNG